MAQPGQLAGPVVRCRASFHADQTWWEAGKKTNNFTAPQPFNHNSGACLIDAMDLKMFLARSSPIVVISLMDGFRCW
jgi:hypothetical protein